MSSRKTQRPLSQNHSPWTGHFQITHTHAANELAALYRMRNRSAASGWRCQRTTRRYHPTFRCSRKHHANAHTITAKKSVSRGSQSPFWVLLPLMTREADFVQRPQSAWAHPAAFRGAGRVLCHLPCALLKTVISQRVPVLRPRHCRVTGRCVTYRWPVAGIEFKFKHATTNKTDISRHKPPPPFLISD